MQMSAVNIPLLDVWKRNKKRMHSSRMRTGRSLTICLSLLPEGGGYPQRNQKKIKKKNQKNQKQKKSKKKKKLGGILITPPSDQTPHLPRTKYTPQD